MRAATVAVLLGMGMLVAAVFIGAGPEWGSAALGVAGLLTLLVGIMDAVPKPGGPDGRP